MSINYEMRDYEKTSATKRPASSRRRLVKLPGEKRHIERSDSATYFARKLEIDRRERRMRAASGNG
ncbi:hypothetical protein ABIF73_003852 [Bradyrhizobium japonicum]|jgi:hypothetical protein